MREQLEGGVALEMGSFGGLALGRLLRTKRTSLIDEQIAAVREWLASGESSPDMEATIVAWVSRAASVRGSEAALWEIFVKTTGRLAARDDVQLATGEAQALLQALGKALADPDLAEEDLATLVRAVDGMVEGLGCVPSLPALAGLMESAIALLAARPAAPGLPLKLAASLVGALVTAVATMPRRKLFEAVTKTMLRPAALLRLELTRLARQRPAEALADLLPPFSVNLATSSAPLPVSPLALALPSGVRSEAQAALERLDRVLERAWFNEESLPLFDSACNSWERIAKKPRISGNAKRARNESLVSYTRQLFAGLKALLGDPATAAAAADIAPWLAQRYIVGVAQLELSQSENEAALGAGDRKRQRSEADAVTAGKISRGLRFFFEISELCEGEHGRVACVRLLRLITQHDVYDVASTADVAALTAWYEARFQAWQAVADPDDALALITTLCLLLAVDHRIVQTNIGEALALAFRSTELVNAAGGPLMAAFSFAPVSELLLRLVEVYAKLRQLITVVPALLGAACTQAEEVLADTKSGVLDGVGTFFARMPAPQVPALWQLLETSGAGEGHGARMATLLLTALAKHVKVTDVTVGEVHGLAVATYADCKKRLASATEAVGAAPVVLLFDTVIALLRVCYSFSFTESGATLGDTRAQCGSDLLAHLCSIPQNGLLSVALCRLAMHALRQGGTDESCDTEAALSVLADSLESNEGEIMEHVALIDRAPPGDQRDRIVLRVWARTLERAVASQDAGPLRNASFFELAAFRDKLAAAVKNYAKAHPESAGVMLDLLAALPREYPTAAAAKRLASIALAHAAKQAAPAARLLVRLLDNNADLVIKTKALLNLGELEPLLRASPELGRALARACAQSAPDRFAEHTKALLKSNKGDSNPDSAAALLFTWLAGGADALMAAKDAGELHEALRPLAKRLLKTAQPAQLGLAALLLHPPGAEAAHKADAELDAALAALRPDNVTKSAEAALFLRALSTASLPLTASRFDQLADKAMTLRLVLARAGAGDSAELDAATVALTARAALDNGQLSSVLSTLIAGLRRARRNAFERTEEDVLQAVCSVQVLKLVSRTLVETPERRHKLQKRGYEVVQLLVLLGMSEGAALPVAQRECCIRILRTMVQSCHGIWDFSRLDLTRVVLEGIQALAHELEEDLGAATSDASAALFLQACELLFALFRYQGVALSNKCPASALALNIALTRCALRHLVAPAPAPLWLQGLDMLTRGCELLSNYANEFRPHAVFWLSRYLTISKTTPLGEDAEDVLRLAAFQWLDLCTRQELQQLHTVSDEASRALLKSLRAAHKETHVFRGQT